MVSVIRFRTISISVLVVVLAYTGIIAGHRLAQHPVQVHGAIGTSDKPLSVAPAKTQITPQDWLNAINVERQKAGVAPLKLDPRLNSSAQRKATEMTSEGLDSTPHIDNQGVRGIEFIKQIAPECVTGAENIAWDYPDISSTVAGWMNSPGHRTELLNPDFQYTGFATDGRFTVEHFCGLY